jgi:PAS domain S-box-containing protein
MVKRASILRLIEILQRPSFWLIPALLVLFTLPHYSQVLTHPGFLTPILDYLSMDRHAFERILFLIPMVCGGFFFGWKGAVITSLAALACMLPRAIFISEHVTDSLLETSAVFIIGNVLAISFASLRREREYRRKIEVTGQELRLSEERYRQLFENAHDAIWLHNLSGDIIIANGAAEELSGYRADELLKMKVRAFLSEESLSLARQIREKLLSNEYFEQPYEQRIIRKKGNVAIVQLTTSLIFHNGEPVAFQHIARDVTEQKQLQENQRYYLAQATRAQEEERKRISRELHDDTIQSLIVLSRQLDAFCSEDGLSKGDQDKLEGLWQKTDSIIQGVRRLSQDLRPAALDKLGLLPALEWLGKEVSQFSSIDTKINIFGEKRRLSEEVELLLFRITQEALRNIWRHSQATETEITVAFEGDTIKISIRDNGIGFNIPGTMGDLARHGKLGLAGMQERARLAGARLNVQSRPGEGTCITVELSQPA